MAEIVLALWTAHGPSLNADPESWSKLVVKDEGRRHWYRGKEYGYNELKALRVAEGFSAKDEISRDIQFARYNACQDAITAMSEAWAAIKPDVCVIMGNDQHELIHDSLMPTFAVYYGDKMWHKPLTAAQEERLPPGIKEAEWANRPKAFVEYPVQTDLAGEIIQAGMDEGFDFAVMNDWPAQDPDHYHTGVPHAFSWLFRRVMKDEVVPTVPILINTFWEPNQPRPRRAFEMGQLVGQTIRSWAEDKRVAVIGSGGMSHFVIDEDLDRKLISAIQSRNATALKSVDPALMKSGTSEWLNWIAAAGAVFDSPIEGDLIAYEPCYRSEAGTGAANGFICWSN